MSRARPEAARESLACDPHLVRVDDFVAPDEAASLFEALEKQPLSVNETGRVCEVDSLPVLEALEGRVAEEVGLTSQVSSVRYRRYEVGEGHPIHPDEYTIADAHLVATAMLVLVAPEEGGTTEFPFAEPFPVSVVPKRGTLVHWRNVLPNGAPATRSVHRGVPVLCGMKAILLVFFYVPLDAFRAHESSRLAAAAPDLPTFAAPRPGTQLTCIVDVGLPGETTDLLRAACDARGILFREVDARAFDYAPSNRLPRGAMLFRPSTSTAASHVEEYLVAPNVATFHGELEGAFFPCTSPLRVRERAGIDGPRTFPVASTEKLLVASFVERLGGFPVVLKVGGGEGGLGVMRVDSMPALRSLLDHLVRGQGMVPMMSAYVPNAMHHRVVVVGGQAICSYENPSREHDFRSTPSDREEAYTVAVPEALAKVAIAAVHAERLAFGGVDVLVHETGRAYVIEVNYPCYFPQATLMAGIDIAGPMVDWLVARAKVLTAEA